MKQKKPIVKVTEQAEPGKGGTGKMLLIIGAAVLAMVTYISFSHAIGNGFINWDDNFYIFDNTDLSKPLPEAIAYFFGPHYFIGNYVPLTMITYALEYHAAGLDTQLFHTVNILLHTANVLLVFWFIYLLSGRKPLVAAMVSLFFGVHPMHVESVVWAAELKDVLYSFFFIAGLIAYYKYSELKTQKLIINAGINETGAEQMQSSQARPSRFLVMAFFFLVLSCLSKPAAVSFPLVLLLIDFYTKRKFDKQALIEKIPFFIVSVVVGIIAIISQHADKLIHDYYPFSQRLFFAAHSLLSYLVKFLLPVNLSIFYPYPQLVNGSLPYLYYIAPVGVILLFYGVYRTLKYTRVVAFGFLFFFVNIILVLQLLSIGDAIMADRYTYVSYIGLLFIIAMGFDGFYNGNNPRLAAYKSAALAVFIVAAMACCYVTYQRCEVWANDDTIATDLLEKYPDDRLALNNKGFILQIQKRYDEAIILYKKAIRLKPDYVMAYANLANSYLAINDFDNAEKTTDAVLKFAPGDFNFLNTKGYISYAQHKYADAIKFFAEATRVNKYNVNGYVYLADCYNLLKDNDNWIKTLDTALIYLPDNYVILNNKGYSLFLTGKYSEAITYYKASLSMKPDFQTASINLANCYRAMDDSAKARR